jgi:putative protein kinase ArgK-like GTPase of G3E family
VSDKLSSPRDLFFHLLAEMLWVERMLVFEVLPSLRKQVQSESLAAAVEEHLAQTRGHVTRVEEAFRALGAEPASARSAAAAGLQSDHEELAGKIAEHREFIEAEGTLAERRRRNLTNEVMQLATVRLRRKLEESVREDESVRQLFEEVVTRRLDPASAAARLLEREL